MANEVTADQIDTIGTPTIAYVVTATLAAMAEQAGDAEPDQLSGLAEWPAESRERYLADLVEQLDILERFVSSMQIAVEAASA